MDASDPGYRCPCCGHLTFGEPPGSYEICAVCFWEDDAIQLRWPDYSGGANRPCLIDAQRNYAEFAAMEHDWADFDASHSEVAGEIAERAGIGSTHAHADIPWYQVPVDYVREFLAITKLVLTGR